MSTVSSDQEKRTARATEGKIRAAAKRNAEKWTYGLELAGYTVIPPKEEESK